MTSTPPVAASPLEGTVAADGTAGGDVREYNGGISGSEDDADSAGFMTSVVVGLMTSTPPVAASTLGGLLRLLVLHLSIALAPYPAPLNNTKHNRTTHDVQRGAQEVPLPLL